MAQRICTLPGCNNSHDIRCPCGQGPRHGQLFHCYLDASLLDDNGCLIWAGPIGKLGYGTLGRQLAHRLVYAICVGPIPPGLRILHHCDNPPCIKALPDALGSAHLFSGTQADNMQDCRAKGRNHRPQGTLSPMAKMTDELVRQLRQRHADGERINDLARAFGIDDSNASRIASRQTWSHVE